MRFTVTADILGFFQSLLESLSEILIFCTAGFAKPAASNLAQQSELTKLHANLRRAIAVCGISDALSRNFLPEHNSGLKILNFFSDRFSEYRNFSYYWLK